MTGFEETSRVWAREALDENFLTRIGNLLTSGSRPGRRLTDDAALSFLLGANNPITASVRTYLPNAFPVRFVAFNKTDDVNWTVKWHQDRVIAVKKRHDLPGFFNWSKKSGVWHCEPPIDILKNMIFARIHLDDSGAGNGCLEIANGSHKSGKIATNEAKEIANKCAQETCAAKSGDILLIKALALHRSAPSKSIKPRRTLRIDYCNTPLPKPLEWLHAI